MHSMFWVFAYICSGCKLATQIAGIITWNVNPWDVRSHSGKIRLSDCSLSHSGKSKKKNQHRTSRSGGKLLPKSQANFGAKELASYFSISRIQLWAKIPGWLRVAIWQDDRYTDKHPILAWKICVASHKSGSWSSSRVAIFVQTQWCFLRSLNF